MIHRYWTGPSSPPHEPWLGNAIRSLNPTIELHDWTDDDLPLPFLTILASCARQVCPADQLRHRSNIIRLYLLIHHGGYWYDYDVIPLCPATSLPYPSAASHGINGSLCNSFLCSPPNNSQLISAYDSIIAAPHSTTARSPDISGERLLHGLFDVPLLAYPFDSRGYKLGADSPFAVHLYSTAGARAQ